MAPRPSSAGRGASGRVQRSGKVLEARSAIDGLADGNDLLWSTDQYGREAVGLLRNGPAIHGNAPIGFLKLQQRT